jgi:predicted nucleic acid-binding protein|tara:strand:+ start:1014 stop:1244 length:231 start_codon:yes stop_codon:yes gene_type:complete
MQQPNSDVDVNVLVSLYHNKLAQSYNQNVLLEARIQTLKQDYEKEKMDLLQQIANLQEEKTESKPKPTLGNIASRK